MRHPRFVLTCLCSLCLAGEASAALIQVRFNGRLTHVHEALESLVSVGDPLRVDMAWDTNAPKGGCADDQHSGHYEMTTVRLAVAGVPLKGRGLIRSNFPEACDAPFVTGVNTLLGDFVPPREVPVALLALLNGSVIFLYQGAALGDIPGPLPFEGWPTTFASHAFSASGRLTTVPEPGSLILVGTGLLWWRLRARRSHNRPEPAGIHISDT